MRAQHDGSGAQLIEVGYLVAKAEAKAGCELKVDTGTDGTWISIQFLGGNGYTMNGGVESIINKLRAFLGV